MAQPQVAPYGSWKSPITTTEAFVKSVGISQIRVDGDTLYWCERRPDGRTVVVQRTVDGEITDVTPSEFNVRTRVHEYGGAAYIVVDGVVYFANFSDQQLYRQRGGSAPEAFATLAGMRYADACFDSQRRRLVLVREDHTNGDAQPVNSITSVDAEQGNRQQVLVAGNDFYASPRLSPDGKRLAWLTWNHPNMPWDSIELWVGELLADGSIGERTLVAGATPESLFQPEFSADGSLYFVGDRSNWWNLYRWREADGQVEALHPMAAEFGEPQWDFGPSTYALISADQMACSYSQDGIAHLALLDTRSVEFTSMEVPYNSIDDLTAAPGGITFIGGSSIAPRELVYLDVQTGKREVIRRSHELTIDRAYFSPAAPVEFPTEGGLTAHAFFYAPKNPDFTGPADKRPPLLVMSHGGPTGAASPVLDYEIQFWTTRGFTVVDVDYGGSSGYGREYRERLKGQWGIVDVADCVNSALYLAEQGFVDSKQLAINGGSAGGFTTLCALTFYDTFKAGASYYGVSDLELLALDTHKFESRYLDGLVGVYPEQRQVYLDRSPIHHTDLLSAPMILLQGLDDPVVPPNQAELMFEAVRGRELPVAYIAFEGEQHGFRKAVNRQRALEAELYFYSKVFGFDLADEIAPVPIENL